MLEAAEAGREEGTLAVCWAVLVNAARQARENKVSMTAQALAYSLFLAIPATLLVVLGVFSLLADEGDVNRLVERAGRVMPEQAATLLGDSLERSTRSTSGGLTMTVVGLVLALWTTSSAATTLMQGIMTTFAAEDQRGFLRKRLVALVIVVCLVGAALFVGFFLVLGPQMERWIGNATGTPTVAAWVWWTAQWPLLIAGMLFAFTVLLYLGPDVEQPRLRLVTIGAAVALVIWLAASGAFAVYTSRFGSYNKTWGTLSAVVVMMIWLWLTSAALLFGAEVNAEAQRRAARAGLSDRGSGSAIGSARP